MSRPAFNETESLALDYIKAIGIITVVIGHYPGDPFNFFRPYVYHMPLFFFLGGILLNTERNLISHSVGILRKHISYIIIVYILIAFIAYILRQIYPIGYTTMWRGNLIDSIYYPIEKNMHGGSYFLVAWFLLAYSFVSFFCFISINLLKRAIQNTGLLCTIVLAISVVAGYVGMNVVAPMYHETKLFYFNLSSQILVGSSFFLMGYVSRNFIMKISGFYGFIAAFLFIYIMQQYGALRPLGIAWSHYYLGFYKQTSTALAGIFAIFCIAKILSTYDYISLFRKLGEYSKPIMSYHILVFVFIDIFFSWFGLWDLNDTRTLKHYSSKFSWPIYVGLGLFVPVMISEGYRKIRNK